MGNIIKNVLLEHYYNVVASIKHAYFLNEYKMRYIVLTDSEK
jgi:hypothetical protein